MKNITLLRVIIFLLIVFGLYKILIHEYDEYMAKKIYTQMEQIDSKLNTLQSNAFVLRAEKESNVELIHQFNQFTVTNFVDIKPVFEDKAHDLAYESVISLQLITIAESTSKVNYKTNHNEMKRLLKQVKANYNQKIIDFTDQIGQLTQEVKELNQNISVINSDSLRELEVARLKFLSKKISETVVDLKGSVMEEVFDNVMENDVIKNDDSESADNQNYVK